MSKRYVKKSPRLSVQFVDGDTEDILLEITNRNWTNVAELFTEHHVNEIMKSHYPNKTFKNIMVLVAAEFSGT